MNQLISKIGPSLLSVLRPLPAGTTSADFILASFPKSGNTWFRFVFAHLIADRMDGKKKIDFYTIEQFSPAVGGRMGKVKRNQQYPDVARPIKTHNNWSWRYSQNRSVLLVRDPTKCLSGYFGYLSEAHNVNYADSDTFLRSWRFGLPAWISFHQSWINRANYVIRYEDLLADPMKWLVALIEYLNLPFTEDELIKALENSSRTAMKQAEENGDPYHEFEYTFVRGEREGRSSTKAFTDANLIQITDQAGNLYELLRSGPRR